MPRLDSPFPPHHRACPVGNALLPAPLVSAMLDGDATATVRSLNGRTPRPRVTVAARDDDATPFALWTSVASHRGRSIGWLRHRADARRNEWTVDAPADVIDLVAWLRAVAPPLAPRLTRALAIAEEAAALLIGPESSSPFDMAVLARQAAQVTSSGQPIPAHTALLTASDTRIWWEVSGLLASDGHVGIRDRHARFAPVAIVSQRADNRALLEALRERTGLGDLMLRGSQLTWRIARAADTARLAERFREYPLPLVSRRRRQVEIWTGAVALKAQGLPARRALADAADELRSARRYGGPHLLCTCESPPAG